MSAEYRWDPKEGGKFIGPGLSRYESARALDEHNAEAICRMLSKAFEAGKKAKAEELRAVLGVHDTPWGVKVG